MTCIVGVLIQFQKRFQMQVLKKCDDWERRIGYFHRKKVKNEIRLLGRCWQRQSTSLIAFILSVLVNVGKRVVCLQKGFKSWCGSRDIEYYKNIRSCKRHTVVHRVFCCFRQFTLPFLGFATHGSESWYCYIQYIWLIY